MRQRVLTAEQIAEAQSLYGKNGWTLRALAVQFGVAISTIHYALHPTVYVPKQAPEWARDIVARLERIEERLGKLR